MSQTDHPVDLQSAIATYMRQRPGTALTVDDIARGIGATRAVTSTMLCRIVNGEARDYPIERTGRARYTWLTLDAAATAARLAHVIIDLTGVDAELATSLAGAAVVPAHHGMDVAQLTSQLDVGAGLLGEANERIAGFTSVLHALAALRQSWQDQATRRARHPGEPVADTLRGCADQLQEAVTRGGEG